MAGAAYDPSYHEPCDNLTDEGQDPAVYDLLTNRVGKVSKVALDVNSDAIATAVATFAFDSSTVNSLSSPGKSHGASQTSDAFLNRSAS